MDKPSELRGMLFDLLDHLEEVASYHRKEAVRIEKAGDSSLGYTAYSRAVVLEGVIEELSEILKR